MKLKKVRIILLILNLIKLPQIPLFPLLVRLNSTAYFNSPVKNSVENGISGRFVREFRFAPENCSFTLKFRCFTREFHAFTRECYHFMGNAKSFRHSNSILKTGTKPVSFVPVSASHGFFHPTIL